MISLRCDEPPAARGDPLFVYMRYVHRYCRSIRIFQARPGDLCCRKEHTVAHSKQADDELFAFGQPNVVIMEIKIIPVKPNVVIRQFLVIYSVSVVQVFENFVRRK